VLRFAAFDRLKPGNTAFTALVLAFFFLVGLGGGVLYRLLPHGSASGASPPAASNASPPQALEVASTPETAGASLAPRAPQVEAAASVPLTPASPEAAVPAPLSPTATTKQPAGAGTAASPPETKAPAKSQLAAAAPPAPASKPGSAVIQTRAAPQKRAAAAEAKLAAPSGEAGPFRIQFGAFSVEDNAHRVQAAIAATGLPVEIARAPGSNGRQLFYVRSQPFADWTSATTAAAAARDRIQHSANPVAIDYVVVADRTAQQTQAATH